MSALLKDILFLFVVRVSRDWPGQMDVKEKERKNDLTINISIWGSAVRVRIKDVESSMDHRQAYLHHRAMYNREPVRIDGVLS